MATFGELKTLFANKYEQTSAPSVGAEIRNRFINLAIENIYDRLRWNWRLKSGSGATDGSAEFDLASDFSEHGLKDRTFKIDGAIWTQINEGDEENYGDANSVFFVSGNIAEGYVANFPCAIPTSGLAVTYRYYRRHTDHTQDEEICLVPKREVVADLAVGMFFQSEGEQEDALPFLEAAEGGITEMTKQKNRGQARRTMRSTNDRNGAIYNSRNMY